MRIYTASSEETLRARQFLTDWAGEGFLTQVQYQLLQQQTVSDLRTTNVFLRQILFLFTLISVGAAALLFFKVFIWHSSDQTTGIFLLIFATVCYAAAELAVSQGRLYRYGIEEALAVFAVGFLCTGLQVALFDGRPHSPGIDKLQSLVPTMGAVFSVWIWRRFGLWYAFLATMVFALFLPGYWAFSRSAQHLLIAGFYLIGLICVAAASSRHRLDYLKEAYSYAEAFLWLGIYLAINLKLSSLDLRGQWWGGDIRAASEFARPFYWTTWVLTWCLPPIVLVRGIRQKDRFVIAMGAIVAVLTFITNKPYLGWQRHTWDPMLLGILLTGVAICLRLWLDRGPSGTRHGFTARRLSGKDKEWMTASSVAVGFVSPQLITPSPQASNPDFRFGGGSSGGGGAGGDF